MGYINIHFSHGSIIEKRIYTVNKTDLILFKKMGGGIETEGWGFQRHFTQSRKPQQ